MEYVLPFGLIFNILISVVYTNYMLSKLLFTDRKTLNDNPFLYDKYLKQINMFIRNRDKVEEYNLLLSGIIEFHRFECNTSTCKFCSREIFYSNSLKIYIERSDYKNFTTEILQIFLLSLYERGVVECNNTVLFISYLNFLLHEIKNNVKVLQMCSAMEINKLSIPQQFAVYGFITHIHENINKENKNNKIVNFDNMLEFQSLRDLFKENLSKNSLINLKLWNSLIINDINFSLYDEGLELYERDKLLEDYYKRIIRIHPMNIEIPKIYAEYVRNIKRDEIYANIINTSNSTNTTTLSIEDIELMELIYSLESVFINVFFTEERSEIKAVSDTITNVFGYSANYIVGNRLETLMPTFFKSIHQKFINFHTILISN